MYNMCQKEGILCQKKRIKFKELAEKRVNNAMKNIQLIGNLSNTRVYEYDVEDVKKIFKTLREQINLAESKFRSKDSSRNFKL